MDLKKWKSKLECIEKELDTLIDVIRFAEIEVDKKLRISIVNILVLLVVIILIIVIVGRIQGWW